ncbi:queuosine precursor transporter [Ancylobacter mangrovi]|uniref:Probable queuosine precursor transporter n=1 Tax=Ancylobacter mangrovi TaxID=2972472 RepID=A0A9X2PF73_9HYPH|nr:queuosine precursor transporter [Ancylobacter mangrovi]MCS0496810.1 queuosine precursor transporter [Ancylobacter mangrovi]MCS0504843.1 queuosine precursor transporter [Ancylobacter mangrovi]
MKIAGTEVTASQLAIPVAAMIAVVAASNVLVQYPVQQFGLSEVLTWGAFTYPVAFLVNDLTNRRFGPSVARRVVYAGFALAVVLSIWLATPRIALASGTAFLVGQLLDISVFNRLRRMSWWQAPLAGSFLGSALDTALFFTLAFAGDADMSFPVTYHLTGITVPLWVGLAFFDFTVKMACALLALVPYGALMGWLKPWGGMQGSPAR